jgi:hypothetical protein
MRATAGFGDVAATGGRLVQLPAVAADARLHDGPMGIHSGTLGPHVKR